VTIWWRKSGTLEVQKNLILSSQLAEELLEDFLVREESKGPKLELAPFYEAVSFISDEAILRRVLANMLKNALEASAAGETVTMGCHKGEEKIVFWVHNPAAMDPEVQRQIFQRFFTTKGPGRGLGTYSMKLLAEEYLGGRVLFESSPENGTRFTVSLPFGVF
jgi:signal transduction histidine kinase